MVKVNIRRYEAPVTHRVLVELESSFCGSIEVQNEDGQAIGIEHQDVNDGFGYKYSNYNEQTQTASWDQTL